MVVAALFEACTIDNDINTPDVVDLGDIEVTFSVDGKVVRSLELPSISHNIEVEVTLNNENLYWTPVSNQEWCKIADEKHRGNGSFTIIINANNSFEAHEDAVISFTASNFSTPMLRVAHDGNAFMLNEVYTASTKSENSKVISVSTPKNTKWSIKSDEWITTSLGTTTTTDGISTTEVTISWNENLGLSRYGSVSLTKEGDNIASGWFNIWQYGTDVNYDSEGFILVEAKDATPLELRVPVQTVKEITLPNWVKYELANNSDNTISYMLQFTDNPSDAQYIRSVQPILSMLSDIANIHLPIIKQEFYNISGVISARGLALFAKTWNDGGDISQWQIDNEVTLVADIDFNEIAEQRWIAIGTEERPWDGIFNGNGKKIYNLATSQPIFGHCEGASIKNTTIDVSAAFEVSESIGNELNMASFANSIVGTTIENCKNYANLTLIAIEDTHEASFVGGLVCKMDGESYIKNSANLGNITISQVNSAITAGGLVAQIGSGEIEASTNSGKILFLDEVYIPKKALYVGGVAGNITEVDGKLLNCSNNGAIQLAGSNIGATIAVGGIAAVCNGTISGCSNGAKGTISTSLKANTHNVGGIAGIVGTDENMLISGNSNGANVNYSPMTTRGTDDEGRILALGGIIGQVQNTKGQIVSNINNGSIKTASSVKFVYVGGVIGWLSGVLDTFKHNSVGLTSVIEGSGRGRTIGIGGMVGMMSNDATLDLEGDTGSVKCTVKGGNCENSNYTVGIGGIAGSANGVATIKNSHIWQGTLYVDSSVTNSNMVGFGGIIGYASNNLTIEKCTSNGLVQSSMETALNGKMGIGGMVGIFNKEDGVCSISECTNHSDLSFGATATKSNYKPVNMAGIIGVAVQGNVTITDCHNKHGFYNRSQNGCVIQLADLTTALKASYTAGIIGSYGINLKDLNQTTNGTLTITNCTNDSTESQNDADYKNMIRSHRGGTAGIAGFVRDASISNCTNLGPIVRTNAGIAGGIVAVAKSSTITNCTATCTAQGGTGSGFAAHCAGGVALLFEESVLDGCSYYGTVITAAKDNFATYFGALSGYTTDGCLIKNCKLGGTVNDVDLTKDNFLQHLAHKSDYPDLAETTNYNVENCSYWSDYQK